MNWVITPLGMHHLVRCALLDMSAHFRIKLSGINNYMNKYKRIEIKCF